jgi:uncharacterized protein YodC (DUF2158 family)
MTQGFKVGDIVQLKSGGPKMTVVDVERAPRGQLQVRCTWFTKQDLMEQGTFPADALEDAND